MDSKLGDLCHWITSHSVADEKSINDVIQSSQHLSDTESEKEGRKLIFYKKLSQDIFFNFLMTHSFGAEQGLLVVSRLSEKILKPKMNAPNRITGD